MKKAHNIAKSWVDKVISDNNWGAFVEDYMAYIVTSSDFISMHMILPSQQSRSEQSFQHFALSHLIFSLHPHFTYSIPFTWEPLQLRVNLYLIKPQIMLTLMAPQKPNTKSSSILAPAKPATAGVTTRSSAHAIAATPTLEVRLLKLLCTTTYTRHS